MTILADKKQKEQISQIYFKTKDENHRNRSKSAENGYFEVRKESFQL